MSQSAPAGPPARPVPTGWRLWLAGARPRTLPAAVVPVLVGTAAAAGVLRTAGGWFMVGPHSGVLFQSDVSSGLKGVIVWRALAAMVVALFIQIGTNYANDYSDGIKGTDNETRVGPDPPRGFGPEAARCGEEGGLRLVRRRCRGRSGPGRRHHVVADPGGAGLLRRRLALHRGPQAVRLLRPR